MNPDMDRLQPYPFEKLARLLEDVQPEPALEPIALSIGEPRHPAPGFVRETLAAALDGLGRYPSIAGEPALREAICRWATTRFALADGTLDPDRNVLPVNGTREALFAIAQLVVDRSRARLVLMPNPFYQIYEGAALLAGAEPLYLDCLPAAGFIPDYRSLPEGVWSRCQLLYLCNPGNPTGSVMDVATMAWLIEQAQRHDFVIAADECYSEIYADEGHPPAGLLQACHRIGLDDFRRCLVFHSLSKRSSLPGLRSGFVAGDADLIRDFHRYRTYHGCSMPPFAQAASIAAWGDETHVQANRSLYRRKFDAVLEILSPVLEVARPVGAFYLWPRTPVDDERFAHELYRRARVTVLPGRYLARERGGMNPGAGRVRMALVAEYDACVEAARRIRACVERL